MIFTIRDSLAQHSQDSQSSLGLLLASCESDFPQAPGAEVWQQSIEQNIAYFMSMRAQQAVANKMDTYSSLAIAMRGTEPMGAKVDAKIKAKMGEDTGTVLPLLLSKLDLSSRAAELGSESAALLQWGQSLAAAVVKQRWQCLALPLITGLELAQFRLVLEGLWFGLYQFRELKSCPTGSVKEELRALLLEAQTAKREQLQLQLRDMERQFAAMQQVLKLVQSPANICTPQFFSDFAMEHVAALPRVHAELWNEARLEREGLNLILAVGRGSPHESRLLQLEYRGAENSSEHIALVGKGVCFDTGGTNLKSNPNMKGMQYDMMGAAIVYGAFYYLASSGLKGNIRAYLPLVENQIGGHAIKTGDIIRSGQGLTVEINNTDAEGRLILADAIYCAKRRRPKLLLDCATLTGASIIALGEQCAAYYCNDNKVAALFSESSRAMGEDVWRLPLFRPYASFLDSQLADTSNISTKSSMGGSLLAALFLEKFALPKATNTDHDKDGPTAWLHLDMAGWSSLDKHPSLGANAQTMGVRLLSHFVRKYLEQ